MTTATTFATTTTTPAAIVTAKARGPRRRPYRAVTPAPTVEVASARLPVVADVGEWAAALGHRIDAHGLAAVAREIDDLVVIARRAGCARVATDVLADATQPEPARVRAFALVVSALGRR